LPAALTSLANVDRGRNGLAGLTEDALLAKAAQAKAEDMARNGYFAHVSPTGATFRDVLASVGYEYTYAGENLAVDFTESADVETAWMNSPTHRANILKDEYTHVGFGIAEGMYEGREVTFVAEFFAAKSAKSTPKGVMAAKDVRRVPAKEPAVIAKIDSGDVLGEEAVVDQARPVPPPQESIAVLATSPSKVVWYMLAAFTALIALLFSVTVMAHVRNKYLYMEVIVGGFFILALGTGILFYNASEVAKVQVPVASSSSAS